MPQILVASKSAVTDRIAARLSPSNLDVEIACPSTPAYWNSLRTAKCVIGWGDMMKQPEFFPSASNLKLIQLLSAGYDGCDIEGARRSGVLIATNGGANSTAVAEHTLLLILALSRRLVWQHHNVITGEWWGGDDLSAVPLFELDGKILGIVGLGAIGKRVARFANAFGMKVYYFDVVRMTEAVEMDIGVEFRLLDELLAVSDIVSLHVPLTERTRAMIGRRELQLMKQSSFLVNTSRGQLIDEEALYKALMHETIAGAGLDVFCQEPPPVDHPLLKSTKVILTPHLAGPTQESWVKRLRNGFDNAGRLLRGERPLWIIPELANSRT